ncbi:MAG: SBBP repeat-containing protein [Polyangiaceae bacterium]
MRQMLATRFLTVLALALGACGSDDSTEATSGSAGQTGSSGAAGGGSAGFGGSTAGSGGSAAGGAAGTSGAPMVGGAAGAGGTAGSSGGGAAGSGGSGGGTGATGGTGTGGTAAQTWVSFLGGSDFEQARDVAVDPQGNIVVVGGTRSKNFPVTAGAYDTTFASGGSALGNGGPMDVFVAKLSPTGKLLWATYVGGPNYDRAYAVETDAKGDIYVGGRAGQQFPTTPGVLQPSFAGDNTVNALYGPQDGFVLKLSSDGKQLIWSTYFGGPGREFLRDLAVDATGATYPGLAAVGPGFPHVTLGAFDTSHNGGYDNAVAKLSADGKTLVWGTYLGGSKDESPPSVRIHSSGQVYVGGGSSSANMPVTAGAFQSKLAGGFDYYFARLSSDGKTLHACTYYGGTGNENTETHTLAIDPQGNAVFGAVTLSPDLPMTLGALQPARKGTADAFVAKMSPNGNTLVAATYLGGNSTDGIQGVAVDSAGNVYVGGTTSSADLPVTANAYQSKHGGGIDAWAARLSPGLSQITYLTYLGGPADDEGRSLWIDASGNIASIGQSASQALPTTPGAFQSKYAGGTDDAFVARFVP